MQRLTAGDQCLRNGMDINEWRTLAAGVTPPVWLP